MNEEKLIEKRSMRAEYVKTVLIGLVMGAAEVVPGVSGGTIAFITGIYERLINAIKQCTPALLFRLKKEGFVAVWQAVDANFLLALFGGMGISIVLFARGISYLLVEHPIFLWSFFFGLVIASTWIVARQISRFGTDLVIFTAVGTSIGVLVTSVVPLELSPTLWFIFLGGAIAVCAWILPGLSGSFILLILGLYGTVIDAIKSFDLEVLIVLGLGCFIGLICFAQLLSKLFRDHKDETLAVLTGFMLGSLAKLWPWKETLSYQMKADGSQFPLVQEPILPQSYIQLTGQDPYLFVAIGIAVAGIVVVLGLDRVAGKFGDSTTI
ncbi:MAG: putative membrane protein [Candidatus Azotimanducaceae bacterium]